jgi:peroxiredoxin
MLAVGDSAPNFELQGAAGGRIDSHTLDEYTRNDWAVVLVFYPFDFHPSCTTQMCLLRDAEGLSFTKNTVIHGVSTDSAFAHRAFADQHRIDFPLLSDSDGTVTHQYGVCVGEIEGHQHVAQSALFVVDPEKQIQYAWRSESADDMPDLADVKKASACHGARYELPDEKSYLF